MRLEAVAQIFNSLPDKISVSGIGIAAQALKIEIKVVGIHVDVNQRTIQIGQHDDRLDGGLAVFAEVSAGGRDLPSRQYRGTPAKAPLLPIPLQYSC